MEEDTLEKVGSCPVEGERTGPSRCDRIIYLGSGWDLLPGDQEPGRGDQPETPQGIASEEDVEKSSFVLASEPPHQNLYLHSGVLRYTDPANGDSQKEGVTINELLRGRTVRNTTWIIGLVAFTGPDTKIYLNGGITPSKQSKIAKETNFHVIVNFVFLLIICMLSAVIYGVLHGQSNTSVKIYEPGVDPTSSTVLNALVTFV